ncbi:MAG TPA: biopolymer transporter ExbD [Polyangia bacterium]|jgi:biopolymer transport protein ExbD
MSIAMGPSGTGGRKALDSDLNLVPYIDLLTCMVTFLLITAVWTQRARVDVAPKTESTIVDGAPPPSAATRLVVIVSEDGFLVGGAAAGTQRTLPKRAGRYDHDTLLAVLRQVKRSFPQKQDLQIGADDAIPYESVVRTMDTALSAAFADVSVTDTAAARL